MPFSTLIGPEQEIYPIDIEVLLPKFFKSLLSTQDMIESFKLIESKYKLIISELMFLMGFKQYCVNECNESRLTERAIEILRKMNNLDCFDISKIAEIKDKLKPNKSHFESLRNKFLIINNKNIDRYKDLTYDYYINEFLKL